jgi:hypothetical protein
MSFNVSADAYLRFMGRYSEPLAAQFADLAGFAAASGCWMWDAGPAELSRRACGTTRADAGR